MRLARPSCRRPGRGAKVTLVLHTASGRSSGNVTERLVTARELGELLSLAPGTILDQWEAGKLPGYKIGRAVRFDPDEILTLTRREAAATSPSLDHARPCRTRCTQNAKERSRNVTGGSPAGNSTPSPPSASTPLSTARARDGRRP